LRREFADARPRLGLRHWRIALRLALVLLPTIAACLYYGVIATDRYVSETRFVIRTASKPVSGMGGLSALLQLVGLSPSEDEAYAVHDFLTSRDALRQLQERVDLRAIYNHPDADFIARYPSLVYGKSDEELYRYFQNMLTVVVNNSTGLIMLRVQTFRAQDSQLVARALLDMSEGLVNKLNERMQEDAVQVAGAEVARDEQRRVENQIAITEFRNRELILDPTKSSAIVLELIGKMSAELAATRTEIAETRGNSPNSPQLQSLRQRADAIEHQIAVERGRVASSSDGLADKIATYERLMLQREFSIRILASAVSALETARVEARRQQMYLERVVEPGLPDEATMPRRWGMVLTIFGYNLIGAGVLWLIGAGLREHAAHAGR
jgi:capsular polysaccharide transport system permease protein